MDCDLFTCRYNTFGICTSEEDREVCVDVAKKVLHITDDETDNEVK